MRKALYLFILLSLVSTVVFGQATDSIDRWDNWFILGNKIVFGGINDFTHSHEIQFRVKDNMQSLDQWFYEGVLTYSPNARWEIVPDFRAAIKPTTFDFRFGMGVVRKDYVGKDKSKKRCNWYNSSNIKLIWIVKKM